MKEVQESRAEKLNVFDLLTLDKIRKGINDSLDPNIIEKLRKEQLITVNEGTTYSLADKYKQFILVRKVLKESPHNNCRKSMSVLKLTIA